MRLPRLTIGYRRSSLPLRFTTSAMTVIAIGIVVTGTAVIVMKNFVIGTTGIGIATATVVKSLHQNSGPHTR